MSYTGESRSPRRMMRSACRYQQSLGQIRNPWRGLSGSECCWLGMNGRMGTAFLSEEANDPSDTCRKEVGKASDVETLWRNFFSNPSQWRDHRSEKVDSNCPDFKHKYTRGALWLENGQNPPWVASEMASIPPGTIQLSKRIARDLIDPRARVEKRWRNFFLDPSQWWDNTAEKENPKFPDFKHKHTKDALWLVDTRNPPWVAAQMASIAPGTLQKHSFSWARQLSRCNQAEQYEMTLQLFEQMKLEGIKPDRFIFVPVLNACACLQALEEGRRIHTQVIETGCESDLYVSSCLVDMYAKCSSIDNAWIVFNKMPTRDVVTWNALILGHVNSGQLSKALELFQQMQGDGISPNAYTFVGLLNACASQGALKEGKWVHGQIKRSELNGFVGSSLVDMYAKCGTIDDAWRVFDKMPKRDVVAWTAMLRGLVNCGQGPKALELFRQMQGERVEPNSFTFVGLLNACASMGALEEGRAVHALIRESGCETDSHVGSSLVDMYAKCSSIDEALNVFNKMPTRDAVVCTAMIHGHVNCRQGLKALEVFQQMQREEIKPDSVTYVGLLNACASIGSLEEGKLVHEQIRRSGCEFNAFVSSSLVDMYAKCGSIDDAWRVFNKMPHRELVAWNAMILGHVNCAQGLKAIELFKQMQREGVRPDPVTYLGLLNACTSLAAIEEGRIAHEHIRQSGCEYDLRVGSSLVDMYAKCGSVQDALMVFNKMPTRGVVAWNAMIGGYAIHGCGGEAIALFEQMCRDGLEPDEVTFVCLLSACSHGGLVKEGMRYFESMTPVYCVSPNLEHYTCMVDLLGRAGQLDDAMRMVKSMPVEPDAGLWMSLLGACRIYGNVEMGEQAAEQVLDLDPKNSGAHVLLSNIYAAVGNWDGYEMIHRKRLERGAWKQPGRTWITVNNEVHSFVANDSHHPQIKEVHAELKRLSEQMKEAGYLPDTRFAIVDDDEETKIDHLSYHSEKLAIAFGLITMPAGAPILIVKNLRVCGDCHNATKFIAKIVERSITVRDGNRFHHFNKDGNCSCGDYW